MPWLPQTQSQKRNADTTLGVLQQQRWGRTIIGTQLLASSLKGDERITVQVNGDGPGGKIMADANGRGEMRGYITNPHVSLELNDKGKLDVRGVVGTNGTITVIKDLNMREPFSGQVPIVDGELGNGLYILLSSL